MLFRDLPVGAMFVRCSDLRAAAGPGPVTVYIKIAPFRPSPEPSTFPGYNAYGAGDEDGSCRVIRDEREVIQLSIDRTWINPAKVTDLPRE